MALFQQLDLYKPSGSRIDKTTLLSLFSGGSWQRNFKNATADDKMETTAFNYTGFIQPKFLIDMLSRDDHDGFYDRIMVCCPSELVVPFKELQVPLPDNIITFYDVFKTIRDLHQTGDTITYKFTNEALDNLAEMHDNLQNQKAETSDENRRGHITKAITQLIRLSGIIHVMENVFDCLSDGLPITRDTWDTEIACDSLDRAWAVVSYNLEQKWAMMPPSVDVPLGVDDDDNYLTKNVVKIRKFLSCLDQPVTPSKAVQQRLVPRTSDPSTGRLKDPNVQCAVAFIEKLQDYGFGEMMESTSGKNKRHTKLFRKRKFDNLSDNVREHLQALEISKEAYDNANVEGTKKLKEEEVNNNSR